MIDGKGRIVIPRELREHLGMREGTRVRIVIDGKRVIMTKPIAPEEFVREMEGCIKEGSPIPLINPLQLKKIWEKL